MGKIWRVIFDTNVLVAAMRSRNGASFQLLSQLDAKKYEIALSYPLYAEYLYAECLDVLMRPEVILKGVSREAIVDFVDNVLLLHEPTTYTFYGVRG